MLNFVSVILIVLRIFLLSDLTCITGGDNCDIDVLGNDGQTAHDLYKRFASITGASNVPVYPSVGNHDRFYAVQASDPLYNEGLFEEYMGTKSYYSFEHKGFQQN
jgi:hypothetical protein